MTSTIAKPPVLGSPLGDLSFKIIGSGVLKEVDCKLRSHKPLKILKAYASLMRVDYDSVKFTFNGKRICFKQTPNNLRMNSGDVIHAERVFVTIKFVSKSYNEVSIRVHLKKSLNIIINNVNEYAERSRRTGNKPVMIYKERIVEDSDTPLGLNMKDGDVIKVYTKEDKINVKTIRVSNGNEVILEASLTLDIKDCVGNSSSCIHNGRFLKREDTPLSLKMKEDAIIQVYAEEDTINFKISLLSDIPNGMNFSLKYGDSLENIIKKYTDRMGINPNSVRFMFGDRRIKSGQSPKQAEIPPNAVIRVFKEYETISLEVLDCNNLSNKSRIQVNYCDTFAKIKENCGLFGTDPFDIVLVSCPPYRIILDEQTPKELEMDNNEILRYHKTRVINLKFVNAIANCPIMDVRVKHLLPLDNVLKECVNTAGVDLDSVKFMFGEHRIRPGSNPYQLSMDDISVVEMHRRVVDIYLKFVGPVDFSKEVVLNVKFESNFESAKKEYSALVGEDVTKLRFMFKKVLIWKDETPEFLQEFHGLKENDVIGVHIEDQPDKYINIKVVGETSVEFNFLADIDVPLGEMKEYYANFVLRPISSLRFLLDGRRINDKDTPRSLKMEEEDVIEVCELVFES